MIKVSLQGFDKVRQQLGAVPAATRRAAATALTLTANGGRFDVQREMSQKVKGGTTTYTNRAIKSLPATEDKLEATVMLRTDGPAKGTPFDKALGHLFSGGSRAWKRMEGAFRHINALPPGHMMVPGSACPLDGFGNPPRALIVQLISYFGAFDKAGFRANMTQRRKDKLASRGTTARGYKTINGVEYFISYGRRGRPGGDRFTHGRFDQHLPPGIWARSGTHGSTVRPIFMFVRIGVWNRMFDMPAIVDRTVSRVWPRNFAKAAAQELRRIGL